MKLNEKDNTLFHNHWNYDEGSYCQSVLSACTVDTKNQYILSNANLMKLLEDHGASYSEWKEDCIRYNDPAELLMWLGY
tara:strand:- start:120 stop:356 length:237 start_codon:yes stop_codon:yes gene_type:complete